MSDPVPPVVPTAVPAAGFIARLAAWLERHRRWLAPLSFAAGLASFLLVRRGPHVAQVLAFTLVLSWLAILLEPLLA
ncbi:MAG TPA: DUF5924 family protein, partial [Candidatus Binatia bacterium]|nr:DUF5924 family protein [Candidatus Binatia bacterium]